MEKETTAIFAQTVWNNKSLLFRALTNIIGTVCINIVMPLLVSLTLASLATGKGDPLAYLPYMAIVVLIGVSANLFGFTNYLRLTAKVQYDLLDKAFYTILHRSVGFHANTIGGKLVSNALVYPTSFGRLGDAVFVQMIPFTLTIVVGISVVLSHSLLMGLGLLGVTLVTIALVIIESRRRSSWRAERKIIQNNMIVHVSDSVVNAQAVKTFAAENRELATHRTLSDHVLALRFRDWSATARSGSIRMGVLLTLQIAFIALLAWLIKRDPSVLAIGIFSFGYMITLTNRLFEIGTMIRNLEEGFLSASSMTEILMEKTEIVDEPNAKKLRVTRGDIAIKDVTFAYQDGTASEPVFSTLQLTIPAGQKVGLVGPSGGGKSTLTRLLLRFDDIQGGSISIDDQDIAKTTQTSLRDAISYVPQEPLLFHRSILENIAYGKPKASLKAVKHAAALAFADEFINKLPAGYDTIVGERGVKLSGGQRQRIAIARAILKDAPILILDEATSALDSESEVYIQKALEQLMQGRTTIVVAHRLSTIQKMDRIIVLQDGHITEDGKHKDLLKKKGMYATLWAHQSGGFIED